MRKFEECYFRDAAEWRIWLAENHESATGIYLIFYTVAHDQQSMRWEEAVREALCFGWIDSTVKSLGSGKRRQYFCPRKPKSAWSSLNKKHIRELKAEGKMHPAGLAKIREAKADGSWTALDAVEKLLIPADLQAAFELNPLAAENYAAFSRSYRKSYLYWLHQAKRQETRDIRIEEIIRLCKANLKSRT